MTGTSQKSYEKLWDLVDDIGVAMLTTRDGDELRSRPMQVYPERDSESIWLFTDIGSGVDFEVSTAPHINLSFVDTKNRNYVSVSGQANVVNDREKAAELWSSEIDLWFKEGPDDPSMRLIRVDVHMGEFWDRETRTMKRLLEKQLAHLSNTRPDLGENAKVSVN